MGKKAKKRAPKRDAEDRMLTAVAAYLKTVGWKPMVIGGVRIEQWPGAGKYNYQFVLKFSGVKVAVQDKEPE